MNRQLYLDKNSNEIDNLLDGIKCTIIKGANIKKYPYKMIDVGDVLYLIENTADGIVKVSCVVKSIKFTDKLTLEDSHRILDEQSAKIMMTNKKIQYLKNRKYLSIIVVDQIKTVHGIIDHTLFGVEEDWVILRPIK